MLLLFVYAALIVSASAGARFGLGSAKIIHAEGNDAVPDSYIVVLKDGTSQDVVARHNNRVDKLFAESGNAKGRQFSIGSFKAYSGKFTAAALAQIQKEPEEQIYRASAVYTQTQNVIWNLSKLNSPTTSAYTYENGTNPVKVYILDSGISSNHPDLLAGRVELGRNFIDPSLVDDAGHGSHVSGTVAGTKYGVFKGTTLVPVKVLDKNGSGSTSALLAAIDYVVQTVTAAASTADKHAAVVNMSLSYGSIVASVETAITNAITSGVHFAVAAGNSNTDACRSTPGQNSNVITVAASTESNYRASFSNYGSCVNIFAPGVNILSYALGSTPEIMHGTSMASPHVAGAMAMILSFVELSPRALRSKLNELSLFNVIRLDKKAQKTPNVMLSVTKITAANLAPSLV